MQDSFSRIVFVAAASIMGLWGLWALLGASTGIGKESYLAFGLISPEVGLACAVLSAVGLWRAARAGKPRRYALGGLLLSFLVAVVPLVTLLTFCDGCIS
jgi:hypothetical protein